MLPFFIKCQLDVMYFNLIFISPTIKRRLVKKSVNQLTKSKTPKHGFMEKSCK